MSPQEAMDALKEAVAKEDEAKIAEARAKLKEALKKEAIATGKKEAEAEAEAESMCKEAEASARKEAEARRKEAETHKEDGSLTVKMTKEQYEKVREILEKEAVKDNPIYKELTSELSKVTKELEDIKKALSTRKGIFKSSDMDKDNGDVDVEKAVKSFLEKTNKIDSNLSRKEQEHSVDAAFRETLKNYFGIK
jgi:colicin import membrane protein